MTRWQYAWLTDQPQTTLGFSHPQAGLAAELTAVLGPTVLTAQSTEWSISFDRTRANLGYLSGLMGDRGWEMFAVVSHSQPGPMGPGMQQTNWYFKRPAPEVAAPLTPPAPVAPAAPQAPPAPPAPMAPPEPPA